MVRSAPRSADVAVRTVASVIAQRLMDVLVISHRPRPAEDHPRTGRWPRPSVPRRPGARAETADERGLCAGRQCTPPARTRAAPSPPPHGPDPLVYEAKPAAGWTKPVTRC